MTMLGPGGGGRLLPCCHFWLVGGCGRVRRLAAALALAGQEVVGLGGCVVGRRGAWPAGQGPVAAVPQVFAWLLSRGCA